MMTFEGTIWWRCSLFPSIIFFGRGKWRKYLLFWDFDLSQMLVIRFVFLHLLQSGLFLVCTLTSKLIRQILYLTILRIVKVIFIGIIPTMYQRFHFSMLSLMLLDDWQLNYIFSNLSAKIMMNRGNRTSYQGFRRKNSLNSFDQDKGPRPSDLTFIRNKHKEDLELVQNMSMELQKLSKRSIGSRSFCDPTSSQSGQPQQVIDLKFNSKTKHTTSLRNIDIQEDDEGDKKEKIGSLAFFNKFEIIEESRSICSDEFDEKPATARDPPKKPQQGLKRRETLKQSLPNPSKKVSIPPKQEPKKSRPDMKNDILELDKMKRQLQAKKYGKQMTSNKYGIPNPNNKRRETIQVNSKGIRQINNQQGKPIYSSKAQVIKSSRNVPKPPVTSASQRKGPEKANQKEKEIEYLEIQSNPSKTKPQESPMAATRMLSDKEKLNLITRLMEMKEVIQKNEVCSDNLQEITYHMSAIEQLLTR